MADPLPTFVVGAGQAGIAILNTLSEIPTGNEKKAFSYYAIDTDRNELNSNAPEEATTRHLPHPADYVEGDIKNYPYLTQDMAQGEKGAQRQRPVGRYKIDNRGTPDLDEIYQDDLYDAIERHYQEHQYAIDTRDQGSFNIFLAHSLGGGTGSGSFPLLAAMLRRIAQEITEEHGVDIYVAGIGIVPQTKLEPEEVDPPGDNVYYPNSYGSFRDILKLGSTSPSDPLGVHLWSRELSARDAEEESDVVDQEIEVDEPAFDNYWLIGVDEDKMSGDPKDTGIEGYAEQVDYRVAESLFALSNYSSSVENWSRDNSRLARLGTFKQGVIELPIDDIEAYCEAKARKERLEEQRDEGLPEQQEEIEAKKRDLEAVQRDPEVILEQSDDEDLEESITNTLQNHLGTGGAVAGQSPEDFRDAMKAIDTQYDLGVQLLAVGRLEDLLEHPQGAVATEDAWRDTIKGQWRELNLSGKAKYGGENADTVKQKQEGVLNFIGDKTDEWEEEIDDLEDREQGIGSKFKSALPGLQTEIDKREEWIEQYQDRRDEVLEHKNEYERIEALRDEVDAIREETRTRLTDQIEAYTEEIEEIQNEIEDLRRELENAERTISDKADDLIDRERSGRRKTVLPIQETKLSDLTKNRLENDLQSLADFVGEFVDEETFNRALEQRYKMSKAWDDSTMSRDMTGISAPDERNEVWFLYHEDNEEYATLSSTASTGTFRGPSGGKIEYIDDPYRMSFVTITNRGPIEGLELFQNFEQMANDGTLDDLSDFNDYRLSFAYPEWYGRDIKEAFEIQAEVDVPRPDPLDLARVRAHSDNEAEKKNYIKKNGLDAYIWQGIHWDQYSPTQEPNPFEGWKDALTNNAVKWDDLVQSTPSPDLKRDWLAGRSDWSELLEAYRDNLVEQAGIEMNFVERES